MTDSHFTGSFDSLYQYWQDEDRALRFKQGGTRAAAIQYILARIETDIHKGTWVDTAIGAGYVQKNLSASVLPNTIIGIDFSRSMLEQIEIPLVQKVLGSTFHLPIREGVANIVTNIFCLSDYPDIHKALGEMARITKHGAVFSHIDYSKKDEYWQKRKELHGETIEENKIVGDINLRDLDDVKVAIPRGVRITEQKLIEYQVDISDTIFTSQVDDPLEITRSFLFTEFYKPRELEDVQ